MPGAPDVDPSLSKGSRPQYELYVRDYLRSDNACNTPINSEFGRNLFKLKPWTWCQMRYTTLTLKQISKAILSQLQTTTSFYKPHVHTFRQNSAISHTAKHCSTKCWATEYIHSMCHASHFFGILFFLVEVFFFLGAVFFYSQQKNKANRNTMMLETSNTDTRKMLFI